MSKSKPAKTTKKKRSYTENKVTVMPKIYCPHCKVGQDAKKVKVCNSYPNGKRRHFCEDCGKSFVSFPAK
jgi:transposase-like protein